MSISIETATHHIDGSQYMKAIAKLWLIRWRHFIMIPIITCIALGVMVNVAFYYVAFMLLCLIIPLIMLFLYFFFALTYDAHMAILNKRLIITPGDSLDIIFEPLDEDHKVPAPIHVPWSAFAYIKCDRQGIIIHLKGSRYRIILIPYNALADGDQTKLLSTIKSLPKNN